MTDRIPWRVVVPVVVVVVALTVTAVVAGRSADDRAGRPDVDPAPSSTTEPPAEAVDSDAPRYSTLAELRAAADLVVTGRVIDTTRGRVFGDTAAGTAIRSRVVTVEVTSVVAGTDPGTRSLLVEEEGWLLDGTPLIVDGLAPSAVGDEGIWFLAAGGDPDLGAYVVVNFQGRYLTNGDALRGAAGDDPLVTGLSGMGLEALVAAVRTLGP